jgi:hypothetical protein
MVFVFTLSPWIALLLVCFLFGYHFKDRLFEPGKMVGPPFAMNSLQRTQQAAHAATSM